MGMRTMTSLRLILARWMLHRYSVTVAIKMLKEVRLARGNGPRWARSRPSGLGSLGWLKMSPPLSPLALRSGSSGVRAQICTSISGRARITTRVATPCTRKEKRIRFAVTRRLLLMLTTTPSSALLDLPVRADALFAPDFMQAVANTVQSAITFTRPSGTNAKKRPAGLVTWLGTASGRRWRTSAGFAADVQSGFD
jgi:hypothetical protein